MIGGLVMALAVVGLVVGVGSSGPQPSAAAAELVGRVVSAALSENSAGFNLDETVTAAGTTIHATGTGACTLKNATCTMTMNFDGALSSVGPITAVVADGTVYEEFGPTLAGRLPTRWVSIPVGGALSGATGSVGSPLEGLTFLTQRGAVVTDEGTATTNGVILHNYGVTFSPSVETNLIAAKLKNDPAWMRGALAQASFQGITETISVDQQGKLAGLQLSEALTNKGTAVNVSFTETITGYGVPVHAVVPPANQVTPMSQLLAGSLG